LSNNPIDGSYQQENEMRKNMLLVAFSACAVLFFQACSSSAPVAKKGELPDWVLLPVVEDGIASAECVNWSGNISIDKAEAEAIARSRISFQLTTKAQAMDKYYGEKISTGADARSQGRFVTVTKQKTESVLRNSRAIKAEPVTVAGERKLCVMVAITQSKKVFEDIIDDAGVDLTQQQEQELYLEFKQDTMQAEMEQQ
jgi:hypothetical protein